MGDELREVAAEAVSQLSRRPVVGMAVCPGRSRIENGAIHAFNCDRNLEPKRGIGPKLGLLQLAGARY